MLLNNHIYGWITGLYMSAYLIRLGNDRDFVMIKLPYASWFQAAHELEPFSISNSLKCER